MVWVLFSILPIIPYTFPLFQVSLTDSPIAYLIWTPVLAFCWAVWNLYQISAYQNKVKQNLLMGLPLLIVTGFLLYFGKEIWPAFFVMRYGALLLWPFWSIGVLWLLFGVGATKAVLKPMIYLILVWPPIYLYMISFTNPLLKTITLSAINQYRDSVSWMHAGSAPGIFQVMYDAQWVGIRVTNACSGSDSTLALLLLFPITLVVFRISTARKVLLVVGGLILVIVANILRIAVILFAVHYVSPSFALDVLHPLLGPILFFIIIIFLMLWGSRNMKPTVGKASNNLHLPDTLGFIAALVIVVIMTVLLLPLYGKHLMM